MKRLLAAVLFLCLSVSFAVSFYTTPPKSFAQSMPYVQNYLAGDTDGSGKLSGKDAVLLLQHLAGWDVEIRTAAADVNCDNTVNGKDAVLLLQSLAGWDISFPTRTSVPVIDTEKYQNTVPEASASYGGLVSAGKDIPLSEKVGTLRNGKYVGLFYFLWMGAHGTRLYDNTQIMEQYSDALYNTNRWGPVGTFHFWGEPLFGYYLSNDRWVMRKHVQMLTDAGVDFLVFDTTNATGAPTMQPISNEGGGNNTYVANALAMLEVLDEYYQQGWKVPQIAFYTNSNSGSAMNVIYDEVYRSHPEYAHLWFQWEGKPMIVGVSSQASARVKDFFRIKESQWPNAPKNSDGFPWMEFDRSLTEQAVYRHNGKTIINVSVAQHNATCKMSASWYGSADRTRSYANGKLNLGPHSASMGYNFSEQWEFALRHDPDMIFITGWNEWIAQRQPSQPGEPIVFVDNASMEASRDIEPMRGGYGDLYYRLMAYYIRKFKGAASNVNTDSTVTIDMNGGFGQWNDIRAYYKDYEGDTVKRDHNLYGGNRTMNLSGRNDIVEAKVCNDDRNIYFFVKTKESMTSPENVYGWMNLYISTGNTKNDSWCGYDFVLNHEPPTDTAVLEKCCYYDGTHEWNKAADVRYTLRDNLMMVEIPKEALGITESDFTIQFKWADNCGPKFPDAFYLYGDCAPMGFMNYVYSAGQG